MRLVNSKVSEAQHSRASVGNARVTGILCDCKWTFRMIKRCVIRLSNKTIIAY